VRRRNNVLRKFDSAHVSLYLEETGIKMLAVRGTEIFQHAEVPLEPGMMNNGMVMEPEQVADRIRGLMAEKRLADRNISVGISGLHSLSRIITLPRLSHELLDEAVRRDSERELPVSLDAVYLSWQVVQSTEDEVKVFVIAHTRNIVDSVMETLRLAELKPGLMDLAPLALIRVANRATAAVIDVRSTEMDIVIMVDGIPEVVRSLSVSQSKTLDEKLAIVQVEFSRTVKYYNQSNRGRALPADLSVFVSGLVSNPEFIQSLSDESGYQVLHSSPRMKYRQEIDPAYYMVNLGLILKRVSLKQQPNLSRVNLNVLPGMYKPKPLSLSTFLAPAGSIIVIYGIVLMSLTLRQTMVSSDSLNNEQYLLSQQYAAQLGLQKATENEIAGLEKKLVERTAFQNRLETAADSVVARKVMINSDMSRVFTDCDPSIQIMSVKHNETAQIVTGTAPAEFLVLEYVSKLRDSGYYVEVVLQDITPQRHGPEIDFTLILKPGV